MTLEFIMQSESQALKNQKTSICFGSDEPAFISQITNSVKIIKCNNIFTCLCLINSN